MKLRKKRLNAVRHWGTLKRLCRRCTIKMTGVVDRLAVASFNDRRRSRGIFRRRTEIVNGKPVKRLVKIRTIYKHAAQ